MYDACANTNAETITSTFSTTAGTSTTLGTMKVTAEAATWDGASTAAGIQANNHWCLIVNQNGTTDKDPANP
jgi:hypothetical protein